MGSQRTVDALKYILLEKIYPLEPQLIRNDSRSAELVRAFLFEVEVQTEDWNKRHRNFNRLERELLATRWKVEPLIGLSEDTIRKYISELWQGGAFDHHVTLTSVKPS